MKNDRRRAGLLLVLLLAFLSGCGHRSTPVEEGNRSQTLHVGTGGEPSELDPHLINAPPDYRVIHAFFEGLTRLDPVAAEPRPGVASSWETSPDGLTHTFHLRPTARWSNGDPLTAENFLYSFRRALSPALGSQYTMLFQAVRGAEAFAAGKLTDFSQVGFAAPNPQTLVITLARPTPYFLALITGNPVWFPVHRGTIEKHGRIDQRGTGWTRPGHFVGNGPFNVAEWRPNQRIVAEKNPAYWDAANVRLRAVHFHPIDNSEAEERAFRAGQLHVTRGVPATRVRAYRAENSPLLAITPELTIRFINVNLQRAPLNDARVRQALALALDRPGYCDRILNGTESPAFGLIPTGMPGYTSGSLLAENAGQARALLAAAGFPGGKGFPKLVFSRETGGSLELSEAIQETWRTVLGIEIALQTNESRQHWSNLQLRQYDLAMGGWNADYPDASTFLDLFVSGGGWNFTHWADSRYDALLAASAAELDPAKRRTALQETEARLLQELPIIPLSFSRTRTLIQPSVRAWPLNVLDRPDFKVTWLKSD